MSKKIFYTTLIIALFSLAVNSQLTEGNWIIGGSGSYTHRTTEFNNGFTPKSSTLTIKPNVGYFIKNKFAIGSLLGYYSHKPLDSDGYTHTYSLGIFSKYYFLKPDKMFNLFTQIYYDRVFSETQSSDYVKIDGNVYGMKIGQVIFFNNSVGLEFSIDYEKQNYKFDSNNTNKSDVIKVGIGFQIHLGE